MSYDKLIEDTIAELIEENIDYYKEIGADVKFRGDLVSEDWYTLKDTTAFDVMSMCRRKIKKKDILVLSITEESDSDGEIINGILFTKDQICEFSEDGIEEVIAYEEIEEVDYNSEDVILTTNENTYHLTCCYNEEGHYSKYMYNFIMDIVDCLRGEKV